MKAGIRIGTMGVLAAGLLVGQMALAQGQAKRPGRGGALAAECEARGAKERQQVREQHKEQMRERMEKHRQARRQLMEAVRAEEDVQKALAMVRAHCVSQHAARAAFHAEQMGQRLAKVGENLGNREMDMAKREEILKRMVKNMEERKARADAQHAGLLANLDALNGKADLTKADILGALRDSRPEMRRDRDGKEGKARGDEMKNRDGTRGKERAEEMKQKREKRRETGPDA